MGYTHYWRNNTPESITAQNWADFIGQIRPILDSANIAYEWDEADKPYVADTDHVRFNGRYGEGWETFILEKSPAHPFACCKTAYRPYDQTVVAVLIIAAEMLPGFEWSSDGSTADHLASIQQVKQHFGRDIYKLTEGQDNGI